MYMRLWSCACHRSASPDQRINPGGNVRDMTDPWIDDDDGDDDRPPHRVGQPRVDRRRVLVWLAAGVPWLAVIALLIMSRGPDHPALNHEKLAEPGEIPGSHHIADQAPALAYPEEAEPLTLLEVQGGWRSRPGSTSASAVATGAAASWLGSLEGDAHPRYVQLAVEAIEQLDARLAVITLAAVPASTADGLRRIGVAVWIDGEHPRVASAPWWLPELPTEVHPLRGTAIDDPARQVAAVDALVSAGYQDIELLRLEQTDSWAYLATIDARTPRGELVATPVLLRRHLDGYAVAGIVLPAPRSELWPDGWDAR